jgi:hypothetical protein
MFKAEKIMKNRKSNQTLWKTLKKSYQYIYVVIGWFVKFLHGGIENATPTGPSLRWLANLRA